LRVVAGAIHESHEGVLFIDEVASLHTLQRYLLTAMQEKKYSIAGKNPQSSGAAVRVDDVPCEFILIAASNINDLPHVLPPLHSRIVGNGYEVLLDTYMPDTVENRAKLVQFAAQEIKIDSKIPPATFAAVNALIDEAKRKAMQFDQAHNALTLRLRELSGILRLAGDIAIQEKSEFIEEGFIGRAVQRGKSISEQLNDKYGSVWNAQASEAGLREKKPEQKEIS